MENQILCSLNCGLPYLWMVASGMGMTVGIRIQSRIKNIGRKKSPGIRQGIKM